MSSLIPRHEYKLYVKRRKLANGGRGGKVTYRILMKGFGDSFEDRD